MQSVMEKIEWHIAMEAYGTEVYFDPDELDDACKILRQARKSSSARNGE